MQNVKEASVLIRTTTVIFLNASGWTKWSCDGSQVKKISYVLTFIQSTEFSGQREKLEKASFTFTLFFCLFELAYLFVLVMSTFNKKVLTCSSPPAIKVAPSSAYE